MSRSTVKSADRVLTILDFLAARPAPVQSVVIARQCGLPRSSTYHLLNVLKDRGWVVYFPASRRWGLGSAVVPIAAAFSRSWPVGLLAAEPLERLAADTGAWAYVARFADGRLVRCADCDPDGTGSTRRSTAWADAPHAHASGRALLNGLGRAEVLRHCGGTSPLPWPGSTPIHVGDLMDRVRSEALLGVHRDQFGARGGIELAAGVGDGRGRPLACVGVAYRDGERPAQGTADRVQQAAEELGAILAGGRQASWPVDEDAALAA